MRDALLKHWPWAVLLGLALGLGLWAVPAPLTPDGPPAKQPPAAEPPAPPRSPQALTREGTPADVPDAARARPDAALTAEQLTERAKAQLALDPAAALRDIEQADKLAGPHDEIRRSLEIHALVRLGKVGQARTLTDRFYRAFPDSEHRAELERLTGYHPRPYGP